MGTLWGILDQSVVVADLKARDKESVIRELVGALCRSGRVSPKQEEVLVQGVLERESKGSTGLGNGVAIPHVKGSSAIREMVGVFGRSKGGVEFQSLDNQPVRIFFLICSPDGADPKDHQLLLRRIAKLAQNDRIRRFLEKAKDASEIMSTLEEASLEA